MHYSMMCLRLLQSLAYANGGQWTVKEISVRVQQLEGGQASGLQTTLLLHD